MTINKNKWQTAFEKELDKSEKRQLSKVKRYYKSEYNKGIENFLSEGQTNFQLLFNATELQKIYRNLYVEIGLNFAKWYAKGFDKFLSKGVNPNQYVSGWENSFASFGSAVGAQRVTLVSGTAKKTLIQVTQKLMRDPEFQALGNTEKGRILRNQFNRYSQYQSERLVRTEATNAANFATMESSKTIFPGAQMRKEWIASFDDRTRSTHSEAGASEPIPFNEAFMVGGSSMMYPGDPSGPSSEVINCRCSVAPFPVKGAQTVGEITDINFGLGGAASTGFGLTDVVSAISSTLVGAAENVVEGAVKTISEAKKSILSMFEKQGWIVEKTQFSRTLQIKNYNQRINILNKLFSKYNFGSSGNFTNKITLRFKSSTRAYGSISIGRFSGDLRKINLGDLTDAFSNRERLIFKKRFSKRFKSAVNESNIDIATTVHEMGHVMARSELMSQREFFNKLSKIRAEYRKDILKFRNDSNYKSFNEIFLGRYANTNIDEFLAEAFTEYTLHSNPSKYARLVGELIDETFKF